jgi:hypothetical protein
MSKGVSSSLFLVSAEVQIVVIGAITTSSSPSESLLAHSKMTIPTAQCLYAESDVQPLSLPAASLYIAVASDNDAVQVRILSADIAPVIA